ncbi:MULTISPECIES: hypothetical protein [unclassified Campylobacter]|nr:MULTISPECIES: hypothetical protein [unclassified Campylobacter]
MKILDFAILSAFVLFMIFLVRGFVLQMKERNDERNSKKKS